MIRLSINVDHVATLRNARGGGHPDPVCAAQMAVQAGADGITAHLREDRRHIKDDDMRKLKENIAMPLNMEMAPVEDMVALALEIRPHACCLVPERREELTTEGGLDVAAGGNWLAGMIAQLNKNDIKTSMFIDPDERQIAASADARAQAVELHTGAYCAAYEAGQAEKAEKEFQLLTHAAQAGHDAGLKIHAGHGLSFATLPQIARLPYLEEASIGHFIIGEAIFDGLPQIIQKMKDIMQSAAP